MVKRKTHLGGDVRRSRRIRRHLRLTTYVRLPLVPDSRIPILRALSRLGLGCPAGRQATNGLPYLGHVLRISAGG